MNIQKPNSFVIPVLLTRVRTRDRIVLDGIAVLPRHRSDTALIWVHGLGSNFSRGQMLIKELSAQCVKNNIALFKFNTRGHDIVNRDAPAKKSLQGAAFEKFEECILDIRAVISYARSLGYKKIILAGHSTGANKVLYYMYKIKDPAVKGLMLLGPMSDSAAGRKKFGIAGLARGVALAKKLAPKNPHALMPAAYGIFSAARFLSIFQEGTNEDTFPYLDPYANWKELKSVRVPLSVIIGERDEYLDRPAQKIVDIFGKNARWTKSLSGIIIKSTDHGFKKKERALAQEIIRWIQQAVV